MKSKTLLGFIFSFFLAFSLFLLVYVGSIQVTLQRPSYLLSTLENVHYYEKIADEFNENLMQGAGAAGFEPSIYKNFVSEKEAKTVSENYIKEYFEKGDAKVSSDEFRVNLIAHIKESVAQQNLIIDESDPALTNYLDKISRTYTSVFAFPFLQYVVMGIQMIDKIMPILLVACIVFMLFASFFLWKLKLEKKQRTLYVVSSFVGGGLMCILIPAGIYIGKFVEHVSLSPQCFYDFFNGYVYGYLKMVSLLGIALIVLGIILGLVAMKKKTMPQVETK